MAGAERPETPTGDEVMRNEPNKPEFVYVTYILTTPEKLWHALTGRAFSSP